MSTRNIIILILVVAALILLAGMASAVYNMTFVDGWLWVFTAIGALLGAVVAWFAVKSHRVIVCLATAVAGAVVFTAGALAVNYFTAFNGHAETERCIVVAKHSEERHFNRRLRRGVYVEGRKYYVYFVTIRFTDGRCKDWPVGASQYVATRIGDHIDVRLSTGALGWSVYRRV